MTVKKVSLLARVLLSVTGVIVVLLGIAFWTGHALTLMPVHAVIGLLFVASLWVLAFLGLKAGAGRALAAGAFAWGLIVPAFGAAQMLLLPGPWHWVVRVAHLAIGVVAMGLGAMLYKRIARGAPGR